MKFISKTISTRGRRRGGVARYHFENGWVSNKPNLAKKDIQIFSELLKEFWETYKPDNDYNCVEIQLGRKVYTVEKHWENEPVMRAYIKRYSWRSSRTFWAIPESC